jgi:DNA-binding GntR family transcriptional regulator
MRNVNTRGSSYTRLVYDYLIGEISEGRLKGGDRIFDEEITKKLGISRTPLREALLLLENDGFVKTYGRKGVFVNTLTTQSVKEIYLVREVLECEAGRLAANMIQDDDLMLIKNTLDKMELAIDEGKFFEYPRLDIEFHCRIVDVCGVELLKRLCTQMSIQGASILVKGAGYDNLVYEYHKDHLRIYQGLKEHNQEEVYSAIKEHIQRGKINLLFEMSAN